MFSLNENWDFKGETGLYKALFGASEEVSLNAAACTTFRAKPKKKKELCVTTPAHSSTSGKDFDDNELQETVRGTEDKGKDSTAAAVKSRKRKQKKSRTEEDLDGESPSKRKKTKLVRDANDSTSFQAAHQIQPSYTIDDGSTVSEKKSKGDGRKRTALHTKMASKMEGARFRWINEQLYTTTGHEAKQMFDKDPALFEVYHTGFATQVSKWPLNPLDKIITYVKSLPSDSVIADFGCGEAQLAQSVPHSVHSFDLVAANSNVIACDMAHVPLAKHSVDIVIFCLSLMGSNVSDFIREARRVLKKEGLLKICEIASRIDSVEDFIENVELFGFKLVKTDTISKMFLDFEFKATFIAKKGDSSNAPSIQLNPCLYKRR